MTPCAPFATTYGETLEYPCGLYDRSIMLAPGKVTLPITVTVSIPVTHRSASTNFGEPPKRMSRKCLKTLDRGYLGSSVNRKGNPPHPLTALLFEVMVKVVGWPRPY